MASEGFFIASPLPWLFFCGIAVGAAFNRISRRADGVRDRERAVARKWIFVSLSLSLAVGFLMIAVFVPGPRKILSWTNLYVFAAGLVLSFLVLRFKKAFGLPFSLLLVVFVIAVALFLKSIVAFTGETEIARVRVLSADDQEMTLELIPADQEPVIVELDGEYFSPVVKVVIFEDFWVFLGSRTWYRFEGVISFRIEKEEEGFRLRQGERAYYLPRPQGISERLYRFFELNEGRIPGVKSVQIEIDSKRVQETGGVERPEEDLESFSIRVQNDGGVQIVREG